MPEQDLSSSPLPIGISCSSVNQLPPADCGDRDPCLSSTGAALLFSTVN